MHSFLSLITSLCYYHSFIQVEIYNITASHISSVVPRKIIVSLHSYSSQAHIFSIYIFLRSWSHIPHASRTSTLLRSWSHIPHASSTSTFLRSWSHIPHASSTSTFRHIWSHISRFCSNNTVGTIQQFFPSAWSNLFACSNIIIIIIGKCRQCKAGREQFTHYQSKDPSPTILTYIEK